MTILRFTGHEKNTLGCYWTNSDGSQDSLEVEECTEGAARVFSLESLNGAWMTVALRYGYGVRCVVGILWPRSYSSDEPPAIMDVVVPAGCRVGVVGAEGESPSQWKLVS